MCAWKRHMLCVWYWPLGRQWFRQVKWCHRRWIILPVNAKHTRTLTHACHFVRVNSNMFLQLSSLSHFFSLILLVFCSFSFFLFLSLWPEAHSVVWRAIDFSSLSFSRWDFDRIMALWKQRKLLFDNRGGGRAESFIYVVANAGGEATIEFIITVSQLKVQPCRTKSHYNRLCFSQNFISQKMSGKCTGSNLTNLN